MWILSTSHINVWAFDNDDIKPLKHQVAFILLTSAIPGILHYLCNFCLQKTSEDGKDNEQNSENSKTTIIESCETELTSIQVKSNTVVEDDLPAGRDTFELSGSNKTASDKNNESTEITEITTSVQAMMTHNSLTDDSKDNDEGFDEATDLNSNSFDDNNDKGINDDDDDEDDYDDDDGWITPDNIGHIRDKMGKGAFGEVPANVTVGCLTTDFAMQVLHLS